MKMTNEEEMFIEKMHLISGKTQGEIKDMVTNIILMVIFDFIAGKKSYIPLFGQLKINYLGDKIVKGRKEANLLVELEPHDYIKKVIGQIIDKEENELGKLLKKKIKNYLVRYLE